MVPLIVVLKDMTKVYMDREDNLILKQYKFSHTPDMKVIAKNRVTREEFFLHDLLMKPEQDEVVKHIDGNTLNNQKANLLKVIKT